ncbi:MAG: DNA cytosine methyltransferase [Firmicutes bacterium HGW-Firmicutes-2]|jgi:DNA (cytosine-5)-methyltransferase 1|nr:MAG: DNA cytosine methyltransferase [Firmicutes bacterium HGW-Firmicutes-2]
MTELIIDNFAGGGGASSGIEMATGRSVDIAINHDPEAIRMHTVNHPASKHYCENVWDIDPVEACNGRPVGLAWFSPDCKHFSKAKGGTPVSNQIRGLAWVAVRWAKKVRPRVIILENVEEFKTWGPLVEVDGKLYPDPKKKGKTFHHFVKQLEKLGYEVDFRELRACDYGAPTIRKRFFMVARCDGEKIVWPVETHGDPEMIEARYGMLKPWRTAADIIDWSLPCPSIFESKEEIFEKYGLRAVRPLAENTLKRLAAGIQKFVIENPNPFIVQVNHSGSSHHYCKEVDKPLNTITATHGYGLAVPYIASYHAQTREGEHRGQAINKPLNTVDTNPRYCVVMSNIMQMNKNSIGQKVDKPLNAVTAGANHFAEVRTFLMSYYGSEKDLGQKIDEPLRTITTKDRFGIVKVMKKDYMIMDIGLRMLTPRELFKAQGFDDDYIIDHDADGNKYSKKEQVARCGNAVPPPFAKALVESNLPELCNQEMTA